MIAYAAHATYASECGTLILPIADEINLPIGTRASSTPHTHTCYALMENVQ